MEFLALKTDIAECKGYNVCPIYSLRMLRQYNNPGDDYVTWYLTDHVTSGGFS